MPPAVAIHLPACPSSPNCVSSEADPADSQHYIEPIRFMGPAGEAKALLVRVLELMPRTTIVKDGEFDLEAVATTAVFRFKDDLHFHIDGEHSRIGVRSASRVGHHDLGKNRRRIEEIRARFAREQQ